MKLELKRSEEVVKGQIVDLLVVVDVVNFNFESFLLLKKVIDGDLGDKIRVKRVVDDFNLSNLYPLISLCFKEDKEGIRKAESIQIR